VDQAVVAHGHHLDPCLVQPAGVGLALVAEHVAVRGLHQRGRQAPEGFRGRAQW
jgi:hypothetical protein